MMGSQIAPRDRRLMRLLALLAMILLPVLFQFLFGTEGEISSITERKVTNYLGAVAVDEGERELLMAILTTPIEGDGRWNPYNSGTFHSHIDHGTSDVTPTSSNDSSNHPQQRNPIQQSGRWLLSQASLQEYHRQLIEEDHNRKKLRTMVTMVVAVLGPLFTILMAVAMQKYNPQPTKKRRSRIEKIRMGLKGSKHRWVSSTSITEENQKEHPSHHQQSPPSVECPICLTTFLEGEVVIVPKHCHCAILSQRTKNGVIIAANVTTDKTTTTTTTPTNSNLPHRIFFHEECMVKWLSNKKTNPKKLCPCCRQPFLGLGKR